MSIITLYIRSCKQTWFDEPLSQSGPFLSHFYNRRVMLDCGNNPTAHKRADIREDEKRLVTAVIHIWDPKMVEGLTKQKQRKSSYLPYINSSYDAS